MNIATFGVETILIYGVTRDPISKEYAIVTKFSNGGNLREVIKKDHNILNWEIIIEMFGILAMD